MPEEDPLVRLKVAFERRIKQRARLRGLVQSISDADWSRRFEGHNSGVGDAVRTLVYSDSYALNCVDGMSLEERKNWPHYVGFERADVMRGWDDNERRKRDWIERLTYELADELLDYFKDREQTIQYERWEVLSQLGNVNSREHQGILHALSMLGHEEELYRILDMPESTPPGMFSSPAKLPPRQKSPITIPASFGLMRHLQRVRWDMIKFLEGVPEGAFFREVTSGVPTLAQAVIMTVQHDIACAEAIAGTPEVIVPDVDSFPTKEACVNGLKYVEQLKNNLFQNHTDAELDRELPFVPAEEPHRRATVRDMLLGLCDTGLPHFVAIGIAVRNLGLGNDLKRAMGIEPGEGPHSMN